MRLTAPTLLPQLPESLDRAMVYGDGFFETIAVFDGVPPLWSYHKARLAITIERLGIAADLAVIEQEVLSLAAQAGSVILRLVIARSGTKRGYDPRDAQNSVFFIESFALPVYPLSIIQSGVGLHLCQHVLPRNPALAGLKHTNRLDHILAAAEWDRSREREGLLLDDTGAVIEGTASNIFIIKAGILQTPVLDYCGVSGVMRACILDLGREVLSLSVEIKRITLADILAADECFICNSVIGVLPVSKIGVAYLEKRSSFIEEITHHVWRKGYERLYA